MSDFPVHLMFPQLLGCGWGRDVTTADDTEQCLEPAHQIIVLHQEDGSTQDVRLCLRHVARILDETTPHHFD